MPEGLITEGGFAPLFDRLRAAKSPADPQFLRFGDRQAVAESVRRELEQLLNTRSPTASRRYAERPLTVIDYGIPDLLEFNPQSSADRSRLAALMARAIDAFEPRLTQVHVTVELAAGRPQELFVRLTAALALADLVEPAHFALTFTSQGCQVKVVDTLPFYGALPGR
jgi:type VI secretion system lysozyme-like protein